MVVAEKSRFEVKMEESRARADKLGVRTVVVENRDRKQYRAVSQSQDDTEYTITQRESGWVCSCPGFYWNGYCKHIGAVANRAEREGWEFGKVSGEGRRV